MRLKFQIVFLFLLVFNFASVFALEDFNVAISNSEDWEDVYSTMLFANLKGADSEFLVSTEHGSVLLNGISKSKKVLVVTNKKKPFVFNYEQTLKNKGFKSVDLIKVKSATLDLIEELPEIKNFVIVGNDYGYNSIAVVPYAKITNSWVFLADRTNIDEISSILKSRQVDDVLVYGYVDREVKDAIKRYNPEYVSTGDKFKDNILIVKKYLKLNPVKQVVLTNGEYIEKEIMLGNNPVLFTGRENVPDQIKDYLKDSSIEIGVLIGNELVGAATNIKRSTGISVIAKFARGSRSPSAGIATVEGLDLFPLPSPRLDLEVYSIKYNSATNQLEVTYKSGSNVPAYVKGTITIRLNGENLRIGDQNPFFIAPGDFKTVVYDDVELLGEEDLSAEVYILFGEVESALDRVLKGNIDIDFINVLDACDLEFVSLTYNKQKEAFYLKVKNLEKISCWADVELRNVLINSVETTLGSEKVKLIGPRDKGTIEIKQRMGEEDLKDNEFIETYVYYGERKESLVKFLKGNLELNINLFSTLTKVIISLVLIIIILIILGVILKLRDDDF